MVARYSSGEFWFFMWYFNIIKDFVVRWLIKKQGHISNGCISEYIPIYAHQG
jgi:hypothetical protein